jgi:heme-degrading monooxygenase HmoA
MLQAWSVRGQWGGQTIECPPAAAQPDSAHQVKVPTRPLMALTRASIRPLKAARFWAMAPAAQASLTAAPGCRLAAGLGEAPLLRQCTMSLWDSVQAMDGYARSGAHLAAIRAAAQHGFFSESMFVRFHVLALQGGWQGQVFD